MNKLVETIKTEPTTENTEVEVLEEGEIPQDSGTGTYRYSSLDELLDIVEVSYPCPIHQTMMDVLKSKKKDCDDVFLRCLTARCPVFCNLDYYNRYYYECQRQGMVRILASLGRGCIFLHFSASSCSPAIAERRVDLPLPTGPVMTVKLFQGAKKLISFRINSSSRCAFA